MADYLQGKSIKKAADFSKATLEAFGSHSVLWENNCQPRLYTQQNYHLGIIGEIKIFLDKNQESLPKIFYNFGNLPIKQRSRIKLLSSEEKLGNT